MRLDSIDLLRGAVIVLMALDHVRDYFSDAHFDPMDLARTTPALFLTRWVTHFCAPVFVFLAGMGAGLLRRRGKSAGDVSLFLASRGAWLVLLEVTVIQFAWSFNLRYDFGLLLQVIWALGASMIVLAVLVFLPVWLVGAFGILMIAAHNVADGLRPADLGSLGPIWTLLHVPGSVRLGGVPFFVVYPLVPWIGVMATGYACAPVFEMPAARRRRVLAAAGAGAVLAFVVLRALNGYGDPRPWTAQPTALGTALSVLDTTKYPPSLLFLLMTLGPAITALAWVEGRSGPAARLLITFGRVPLFFYLLHLYVIHLMAVGAGALQGFRASAMQDAFLRLPTAYGFGLPMVYGVWVTVVLGLLLPCAWFAKVKARSRSVWLSYL